MKPQEAHTRLLQLLRTSLAANRQLRQEVARLRASPAEPIAIVSMACRLPGGVRDPEGLWDLLESETDAITEVPAKRWRIEDWYDPEPAVPGRVSTRWGGFLEDLDRFDPEFFDISPREAVSLDPQQRLLLETGWEAVERAGLTREQLFGSDTGVFVGLCGAEYQTLSMARAASITPYSLTGGAHSTSVGRLSYWLGLRGPNLAIDTACSSSLVAVHLACQALRQRECSLAFAGGANVILSPQGTVYFSQVRAMSPTGRCRAFDDAAAGFVRSEGCGIVLLKRLSDAVAQGDPVIAVLRGSAVNHDGRSQGFTAPSGLAQQEVMRSALRLAGLTAAQVDYVEAHGTGTALGDPIEVEALSAAYGEGRSPSRPLRIGSLKSNIGHTEAAAGIAGLIKAALMVQRGVVPRSLHLRTPNRRIDWASHAIELATERRRWDTADAPRIAGVSSFGLSGTNCHLLVAQASAPVDAQPAPLAGRRPLQLLALSARNETALEQRARDLRQQLATQPSLALPDVCRSSTQFQSHLTHRLALPVCERGALLAALADAAAGETPLGASRGAPSARGARPRVAFLFSGHGAHYPGMGRQLYATQPTFRAALDRCAAWLVDELPRPLLEILDPPAGAPALLDQAAFVQPALFSLQYALCAMWRSWGVEPDFVIGHSAGEYAAACAAGVFSLEDGLQLITARGRGMQALPPGGAMRAVRAGAARVALAVRGFEETLAIAAINGPEQTVISGAQAHVQRVAAELEAAGIETTALAIPIAAHSPLMKPALAEFAPVSQRVAYQRPLLPLIGNLWGREVGDEMADPGYWQRHLLEPVRFADGIAALRDLGADVFLEIGPQPTLLGMARTSFPATFGTWLPSLRRGHEAWSTVLASLAALYARGVEIDWAAFEAPYGRKRVVLPSYPFQRQRYWFEGGNEPLPSQKPPHPLLGAPLCTARGEVVLETRLGADSPCFLADHQVFGQAVLPATAFLEMALSAWRLALGPGLRELVSLELAEPLILPSEGALPVQLVLGSSNGGARSVEIFSRPEDADSTRWTRHASGQLRPASGSEPERGTLAAARDRCSEPVDSVALYEQLEAAGLRYGPSFRSVDLLRRGAGEAIARLRLPAGVTRDAAEYLAHPAALDAALHGIAAALAGQVRAATPYLPFALERFHCQGLAGKNELWAHAVLGADSTAEQVSAGVTIFDPEGRAVGWFEGLRLRRGHAVRFRGASARLDSLLFRQGWEPRPQASSAGAVAGAWLVLGQGRLRDALVTALRSAGGHAVAALLANPSPAALSHGLRQLPAGPRGVIALWGEEEPGADPAAETEARCLAARELVRALIRCATPPVAELCWVTRAASPHPGGAVSPSQAAIDALGRTVQNEHPELACRLIDLQPAAERAEELILAELLQRDGENQIAYRAGQRLVARLERVRDTAPTELAIPEGPNYGLLPGRSGVLEELSWTALGRRAPGPREVEIEVKASGLNFRDLASVLRMLPESAPLGAECAGVVARVGAEVGEFVPGDLVMALASGSFARYVTVDARVVVRQPAGLSHAEAATIPVVFATAWYALRDLGQLAPGERVLIHAAAGGVGMASVQLARLWGAEPIATASRPKWDTVRALGVKHVASSRGPGFGTSVRAVTGGEGVDLVLNCLTGPLVDEGLSVLREGGRFIELGKVDVRPADEVESAHPRVRYRAFDLIEAGADRLQAILREVVAAFERGALHALPTTELPVGRAAEAFRIMAQGKHVGKIVLLPAPGGSRLRGDGTWLISGGLGGLGLRVAAWLVAQGVRRLVLVGRTAPKPERAALLAGLREAGADVRVALADVADEQQLTAVLAELTDGPPLRGVVHAAGMLDDAPLQSLSVAQLLRVMRPKVQGSWNLHRLTLEHPVEHFVLFSSAASLLGSPGQANYAAGNGFLDGLAHFRRGLKLPALSINWGPWAETGMVTELSEADRARMARLGMGLINPTLGLRALAAGLSRDAAQLAVLPLELGTGAASVPRLLRAVVKQPRGATTASRLAELEQLPSAERPGFVLGWLRQEVAKVLALASVDSVRPDLPLRQLGLDSLMTIELRNAIAGVFGTTLPAHAVFAYPSLEAVAADVVGRVTPGTVEPSCELRYDAAEEWALPPEIVATSAGGRAARGATLLTGATGFLGAFVLDELLRTSRHAVICLVRAQDAADAARRVRENLARYGLWRDAAAERLSAIACDLSEPRFGLGEAAFEHLAGRIGAIMHCAARVSWMEPYAQLRACNVAGTRELLRLACQSGAIPLHYVSSAGVGLVQPQPEAALQEAVRAAQGTLLDLDSGYLQTKWVCERLLAAARERGLPVTIYQPGFVTGHARTGIDSASPSQYVFALLKGSVQLTRFPDALELRFVPVDQAARAIVALSQNPAADGLDVVLDSPNALAAAEVAKALRAEGYPVRLQAYASWRRDLLEGVLQRGESHALAPLVDVFMALTRAHIRALAPQRDWLLSRPRARRPEAVDPTLACPAVDGSLIRQYVRYYRSIQALPATVPEGVST